MPHSKHDLQVSVRLLRGQHRVRNATRAIPILLFRCIKNDGVFVFSIKEDKAFEF